MVSQMPIAKLAWAFGKDVLNKIVEGIKENAVITSIATLGLVGGACYRIYWRDPSFVAWPETTDEWYEREKLVTMLIDAANHLMVGCHLAEREVSTKADKADPAHSLLCIQVSTAKLLAAFHWKAASRLRCSFSRIVREKLIESFCTFTSIFAELKIHPHMQLLIAEKAFGKSNFDLHSELMGETVSEPMKSLKTLASLASSLQKIRSIKEECIFLLTVLDPKKLRWISVEDMDKYSKARGNTSGEKGNTSGEKGNTNGEN